MDRETVANPASVRSMLGRIAASPFFAESGRLSRFLSYVVEEALAGRGYAIKESTIGVEVFGRPPGYDPKTDAIVRVEAGRLRSKLAMYYTGPGLADPVRIELPRGTYVPVFSGSEVAELLTLRPATPAPWRRGRWRAVIVAGLIVIAAAAVFLWSRHLRSSERWRLSIAVLPFVDASSEPDTAHFATALVREMSSTIARENAFSVTSLAAANQFVNALPDLASLHSKLHVDAVLEGTVQRHAERMRVTVQLVSSRDGRQVWSQTYEALPGRSAEFQEKVSNLIARTLRARFAGVPESRFSSPPTANGDAMALYLNGQEAWLTQRRLGILESLDYYHRAIGKDAHFANAYEGIAASELYLASLDYPHADEHASRAKAAALKAIALDDRLDDAHARLGNIFLRREWKFVGAEQELRRSVTLGPGSSPITRWYSEAARLRERYANAREELENGLMSNPTSEVIETEIGMLDLEMDKVADAEAHMRRSVAESPNYRPAHLLAGLVHERSGRFREAESEFQSCLNESEFGRYCLAALGYVYGLEGKTGSALYVAAQLENGRGRWLSLAALVHIGIGDRERALSALEQAYRERDKILPLIKIDFRFRPLHSERRYTELIKRIGLAAPIQ